MVMGSLPEIRQEQQQRREHFQLPVMFRKPCIYRIFIPLPFLFAQSLDSVTYHATEIRSLRTFAWRRPMNDLFMLGIMVGLFLLMTGLLKIGVRLLQKR
jgi:hypothetical protein